MATARLVWRWAHDRRLAVAPAALRLSTQAQPALLLPAGLAVGIPSIQDHSAESDEADTPWTLTVHVPGYEPLERTIVPAPDTDMAILLSEEDDLNKLEDRPSSAVPHGVIGTTDWSSWKTRQPRIRSDSILPVLRDNG